MVGNQVRGIDDRPPPPPNRRQATGVPPGRGRGNVPPPSCCPAPTPRLGFGLGPGARHAAQSACQAPPPRDGRPSQSGGRIRGNVRGHGDVPRGVDDPSKTGVKPAKAPKSALARKWAIFDSDRETSDTDLESWARLYIPGFQAVIPRVEFPEVADLEPGHSWVLNLDRGLYDRDGTHWVGAYVSRKRPLVLYFDSFGMPAPKEVVLAAWKSGRGLVRSDVRYQDFGQENCGPRALAVLHYLAKAPDDIAAFKELAQED
jgi:hypothetical protein